MATDLHTLTGSVPTPERELAENLPLLRYRLRHLLYFISFMSLLMAAMAVWDGLRALALLLATLVIAFHLLSTAIGTQLRAHTDRLHPRGPELHPRSDAHEIHDAPLPEAPPSIQADCRSPWHQRSTPLPWRYGWIAVAAFLGGLAGAILLSLSIGERTSLAGIVVGALSMAVISGWFAFVGYSFYTVFRHGVADAMANDARKFGR